ncbi:NTP transferase domain-containing protein [Halorubrum trueperi]|uniref:NTP transferase domain-containing protein n=1 Tax=Halorubrum trueperi TaxID=2004704 RepID=A0ABD5UGE3_9EURY
MCGGRGTRLGGDAEKPLTPIAGRPMVDRVLGALDRSRVETTVAVVSPHTNETREHLAEITGSAGSAAHRSGLRLIDAPGDGYVADLRYALTEVDAVDPPVLTVAADLPLLDGEAVDAVLDAASAANSDSLTVCVPAEQKRALGVSADASTEIDGRKVVPAGVNVVGGGSVRSGDSRDEPDERDADDGTGRDGGEVYRTDDVRYAVNVNYPSDVRIAERLLAEEIASGPDDAAAPNDDDAEAPDGNADTTRSDP